MSSFLKQIVLQGTEYSGFNQFFRWKTRNRLLGLCYHGVIGDAAPWDDPRTRIAVSETQFDRQMRELRRYWNPISLSELDERFRAGQKIPEKSVFVTFDDGFRNNLTKAAPILKRYEIPATVFLTTNLIGGENTIWPLELFERILDRQATELPASLGLPEMPTNTDIAAKREYAARVVEICKQQSGDETQKVLEFFRQESRFEPTLPWQHELYEMLDWNEVRRLPNYGIEVGAHTLSHCNLAQVPPEEAEEELRRSKEIVERQCGIDCFAVAYPFGDAGAFSDTVVETARKLGFRLAVTLRQRRNPTELDPLRLDRLCVTGDWSFATFRSLIAGWRT